MPSPFPGMDPCLEHDSAWHDFHYLFIAACFRTLVPQARPKYIVKIDCNVYIHEQSAEQRLIGRPDIAVSRAPEHRANSPSIAIAAPSYASAPLTVDVEKIEYIEIRDRESCELVTVMELLSPTNKRAGSDREQYLAKRKQYFASNANFVEIDLLRGFERLPLEGLASSDYYAFVSRADERPRVGVWPISLRDSLPTIPIPLRSPDPDVSLDLQELFTQAYDDAGFADYVYEQSPQPRLSPENDTWAKKLIAGRSSH